MAGGTKRSETVRYDCGCLVQSVVVDAPSSGVRQVKKMRWVQCGRDWCSCDLSGMNDGEEFLD